MGKRSRFRHRGKNRAPKPQSSPAAGGTSVARSDAPSNEQIKEGLDKGDFETVISLLREEESKYPLTDAQLTDLAHALLFGDKEHYPDSALEAIRRIKIHSARSRRIEIRCYIGKGEWDKAVELAESLLAENDTPLTRYVLCLALLKDRDVEDLKVYSLDHLTDEKKERLSTSARLKEVLESTINQDGCYPEFFCWIELIWRQEGEADSEKKDLRRGIELLQRALEIYPNDEQIRYQLAQRLVEAGDAKAALELLQWSLTAPGASGVPFLEGCDIAARAGDPNTALRFLEAAETAEVVSGSGKDLRKAELLKMTDKPDEARLLYETVSSNTEDPNARRAALTKLVMLDAEVADPEQLSEHLSSLVATWLDCLDGADRYSDGVMPVWIMYKRPHYRHQSYTSDLWGSYEDAREMADIVLQRLPEIEPRTSELTRARLFQLLHKACSMTEGGSEAQITEQLVKYAHLLDSRHVWYDIEETAKRLGDYLTAFDAHIRYCLMSLDGDKELYPYFESGDWNEEGEELPIEKCLEKVNKKVSTAIHRKFLKHLKTADSKAKEQVFLPIFIENLAPLYVAHQMYKQIVEGSEKLLEDFPDDTDLLWKHAYYSHELESHYAAEKSYKHLLELQPDYYSALHNLALILRGRRDLKDALELSDKAVALATDDEQLAKLNKSIRADIELEEQAKTKWEEVDFYKRKILYHLRHSEFRNYAGLSKKAEIDEKPLRGHCRRLVEQGWLAEIGERHCKISRMLWLLPNDLLAQALDKTYRGKAPASGGAGLNHTPDFNSAQGIRTTYVSAGSRDVIKPVFNSQNEYRFYSEFVHLFPHHMVVPNMSLQSVFKYDGIKGLLSSEDFRYYLMAQVDICIISLKDFRPRYAFEIDSVFHDSEAQMVKDDRKDRIFRVGGVPFIRMRPFGFTTDEDIKNEIVRAMRALPEVFKGETPNLSLELDMDEMEADGVF